MRIPVPGRPALRLSLRVCRVTGILWLLSVSLPSFALVGGSTLPNQADPGDAGRRAVAPLTRNGTPFCTAWLASPRRAVTAAHCMSDVDDLPALDLEILAADGSRVPLPVVAAEIKPDADLAVLTLGVAPWAELGVEPLSWRAVAPANNWIGRRIEVAGAGTGTPEDQGIAWGTCTVTEVEPAGMHFLCDDGVGPCRGDSGGPCLLEAEGSTPVQVVAVQTSGALDCDGAGWAIRTDTTAAWIQEAIARPLPAVSEPCGDAPDKCDGRVEWRCRGGWWRTRDCALLDAGCGDRGLGLGAGCLPPSCGDLDARGACDAGQARWCGIGGLQNQNCPALGLACGWDATAGGYRCGPATADAVSEATPDATAVVTNADEPTAEDAAGTGGCNAGRNPASLPSVWMVAGLLGGWIVATRRNRHELVQKRSWT